MPLSEDQNSLQHNSSRDQARPKGYVETIFLGYVKFMNIYEQFETNSEAVDSFWLTEMCKMIF